MTFQGQLVVLLTDLLPVASRCSTETVVRSREPFKFSWAPTISLEGLKLQ